MAIVAVLALGLFLVSQALPKESRQSNAGTLPTGSAQTQAPDITFSPVPEVTASPASPAPSESAANAASDSPAPETTAAASPAPSESAADAASDGPTPVPTLAPAEAYLKVQVGSMVFEPVPLTEERDIELIQKDGKTNVVRVTRDSIVMHSANCDNQDCVHQGLVSLQNRDKRVLQNMIICLPNQVVLELLDAEEAQADWESVYGQAPAASARP